MRRMHPPSAPLSLQPLLRTGLDPSAQLRRVCNIDIGSRELLQKWGVPPGDALDVVFVQEYQDWLSGLSPRLPMRHRSVLNAVKELAVPGTSRMRSRP